MKNRFFQIGVRVLKNKFVLAFLVFVVWVGVFDENNLLERRNLLRELKQLGNDKEYYLEQIKIDAARLRELKTNNQNLEKYAREQYLMHRNEEDVFVIVKE
jgi:cell division protein DivIC